MKTFILTLIASLSLSSTWAAEPPAVPSAFVHHDLKVRLDPEKHLLEVEDAITIPDTLLARMGGRITFILHEGLHPSSPTPGVKIVRGKERTPAANVTTEAYTVALPPGGHHLVLRYRGEIHHPLEPAGEEYARGFKETPGIISPEGIFLAGQSLWYPSFGNDLLTFTLDLESPEDREAISQGERTRHEKKDGSIHVRWESKEPQDEIYLIGGPFTEYSRSAGSVQAMVFLRNPDEKLANNYLEATSHYLEMYSKLLGPYPYKKFALVENFWETGYGMPSFTLLGPTVIRLPFIIQSSYPHEILHNWWGNSVYVDYPSGNWSEGLTAYLADHLIQEQHGQGADYRRSILQKYADYVKGARDFPLTEFRGRHSAATEAVGYGKTMFLFHMLRQHLWDDTFIKGLREFYRKNRFRRATFDDLRSAFKGVSGRDLKVEFSQWVTRRGAPGLRVSMAKAEPYDKGYRLTAILEQTQPDPVYVLRVPIAVHLDGKDNAYQTIVQMDKKRLDLVLDLPSRPLYLDIDPEFDIFRRVDREEIPPALTQAFGAEEALILIPSGANKELREAYQKLAESLQRSQSWKLEVKLDSELASLPGDRSIWILGWENRFLKEVIAPLSPYQVSMNDSDIRIGNTELRRDRHSIALTGRNPSNPDMTMTFVATENPAALPGLGRKLVHYGKYSYLGFEGDEPANIAKGQWPVLASPMSIPVVQPDGSTVQPSKAKLSTTMALAELPPAFSEERMLKDVNWLAGEALRGRGLGTPELDRAADFIAEEFRKAGLKPGGDMENGYFQIWKDQTGDPSREIKLKNVVGILPGKRPDRHGQSVVIGAHYDHLGLGWPDAHKGDEGKIHPGADDNASGVAVLLEMARLLARQDPFDRTIIFVAFTGEEAELRGSRHYVTHQGEFPKEKIIGMLNMDTVGRLGQNRLMILGVGSAKEWLHIFNGAGAVTGVQLESVANDFGSSDQKSFLEAGVPAVQFFSGPNLDYHRPTDTIDKIDPAGLVKVAAVLKEAVEYLSTRPDPLTSMLTHGDTEQKKEDLPEKRREVSLGIIPDFSYTGKGVRLIGVSPGSSAGQAGLALGDLIIRFNETAVQDLRALNDLLRNLQPGDSISITFLREGKELTVEAKVGAR